MPGAVFLDENFGLSFDLVFDLGFDLIFGLNPDLTDEAIGCSEQEEPRQVEQREMDQ